MANIFETISNLSDVLRSGKDGIYKVANDAKTAAADKVNNMRSDRKVSGAEAKKIAQEEEARNRAASMLGTSNESATEVKIDGQVVFDGDLNIDKSRNAFDTVGEYNDVQMKAGVLVGDEIENWLKGIKKEKDTDADEYSEYLAKKNGQVKEKQEVDVKGMKAKIKMAEMFRQNFQTSGSFSGKTDMYNQVSGLKISDDNITKTANLSYILDTFCGDLNSKSLLNAIKNNASEIRMAEAIRDCLDGVISQETTIQKIFAEIHGIDSSCLENKEYQDEALVYLAAIQELSPQADIADIASETPAALKSLRDAVLTGKSFNNRRFLAEMGVRNNVSKALETGDICITNVKVNERTEGCIVYAPDLFNESVDIYREQNGKERKLGRANENGMIEGSLEDVIKIVERSDIGEEEQNELDKEIDEQTRITRAQALANPMSAAEKKRHEQERQQAEEAMESLRRRGFGSGV